MKYQFTKAYFLDTNDGNPLTTDARIDDALKLLKTKEDCIEILGFPKCYNREDLLKVLELSK